MGYIKNTDRLLVGDRVVNTKEFESCSGKFTVGSCVTITGIDPIRGYTITDDEGNSISEIGWSGLQKL